MMEIDLSKLLGGQEFNVHSQIAYNGLSFPMTTLADTGANGSLFIDTQQAIEIAKYFEISIIHRHVIREGRAGIRPKAIRPSGFGLEAA